MDDDQTSIFSYDGEGEPDSFSLHELKSAVNNYFQTSCQLEKLAEGGYHKVYNVLRANGAPLEAVVRVACPAFPKDKLDSEVATYKFLYAHTKVPVPPILTWNSDASNPVGAEYMIMHKVPGISASDKWESLSIEVKKTVVSQVAQYLLEIFYLRFAHAGSLYWKISPEDYILRFSPPGLHSLTAQSTEFLIGPIVSTPFYRALDGFVRIPDVPISQKNAANRGPFSKVSDYLASFLRAELKFLTDHRSIALSELDEDAASAEIRLEQGERVINKALQLCSLYPGDLQIPEHVGTPNEPFSLKLDDFRLSNIIIDEDSGHVNGLIDFEGATTAPLWECAILPRWLQEPHDPEGSYEGGAPEARSILRATFLATVTGNDQRGEWLQAHEMGRPFRRLVDRLNFQVNVWASDDMELWIDERLEWAKAHSRVGFPEPVL